MRVSPLKQPELYEDYLQLSAPRRLLRRLGHLARRSMIIEPKEYDYQPVTNATAAIGRYIGEHMDARRLSSVSVRGAALTTDSPVYKLSEIEERRKHEHAAGPIPIPRVVCTVFGQNFGTFTARRDRFMCTFGIFDLEDGGRVVQAEPFQWVGRRFRQGNEGVRETYRELFDAEPHDPDYAGLTTFTLGTFDEGITFTESRPFNRHAFGMDLVSVMEYISCSVYDEDLNFQLLEGRIEQYADDSE